MGKVVFMLTLLSASLLSSGQDVLINSFYHQFDVPDEKVSYRQYTSSSNEAKQVVSLFFLFYKEFISSQDMDVCVFTPSCSVYAMESVKRYGMIKGGLNAFDRLTRCHGFAGRYYHIHPQTQKYYDPIEQEK